MLYSAYGEPRMCHPLDMDRDGNVGGGANDEEWQDDFAALQEIDNKVQLDSRWELLAMVYCASESPCVDPPPMTNQQYFAANYPPQPHDVREEMSGISGVPLYAGYWWDDRLKLFHVRHRVYDPKQGRFLQRDPIGYAGGNNLYMYAGNDPFRAVDPLGLDSYWVRSAFRYFGMDGAGDFVDDAVDGGREFISPESEEGRRARAAAGTAVLTAAAAVVIVSTGGTALAAGGMLVAANTLTYGATIAGGIYMADTAYAAASGSYAFTGETLSPEDRRVLAWELIGGLGGAKAGSKVAKGINAEIRSFNETFHEQLARVNGGTYERWMGRGEYDVVMRTGQLPPRLNGGRWTYATPDSYGDPLTAQRALALPNTPDVVVRFRANGGSLGAPTIVDPQFGQPGGGLEVRAPGHISVPITVQPGTRCFAQ